MALKADSLAVVILSHRVGVGKSLRPCWRSKLTICELVALQRSELAGSELAFWRRSEHRRSSKLARSKLAAGGMSSYLTGSPPVSGVSLLIMSSHSQGRDALLWGPKSTVASELAF